MERELHVLNAEYFSFNTESCVDLHPLAKCVYQERFCMLRDERKDCDLLVKLVVQLMMNSPNNQFKQSALIN